MSQSLREFTIRIHDEGTGEKQLYDEEMENRRTDTIDDTKDMPMLESVQYEDKENERIDAVIDKQLKIRKKYKLYENEQENGQTEDKEAQLIEKGSGDQAKQHKERKQLSVNNQENLPLANSEKQTPRNSNACQDKDLAILHKIKTLAIGEQVNAPVGAALQYGAGASYHGDAIECRDWSDAVLSQDKHSVYVLSPATPRFLGISMHANHRLILSDGGDLETEGYMHLYDTYRNTSWKMALGFAFSAVQVDPLRIAVSITCENKIQIIKVHPKVSKYRVEKTFDCPYPPGCLAALRNGHVAVSWTNPPAFGVIDVSGNEIKEILYMDKDKTGRKMKYSTYIAVDESRNHVFQSCAEDKALYCFDFSGEPVFKYTHDDLEHPSGVAVDQYGNSILCDHTKSGRIHVVSCKGETLHVCTDVPSMPLAVCIDAKGTGIWVTQVDQPEVVVHLRLKLK